MTLEVLNSDALDDVRHGFFTRKGGVSSGIFEGLNCGQGSSDQAEAVQLNRSRVAEAMGVGLGHLCSVHQVHSATVWTDVTPGQDRPKADAMVTNKTGLALGILTADCQPVLFADKEAQVIGAAHAGWRGAMDGVLGATVDAMEEMGADRNRIQAVIGPSISQSAYEVGPEFYDTFFKADAENERFFVAGSREKGGDRFFFDLPAYGLKRLADAGVKAASWTQHCTYSDPERFFSYRRATHAGEADYGRLISVIRL